MAEVAVPGGDEKEVEGTFEWLVDVEAMAPTLIDRLRAAMPSAVQSIRGEEEEEEEEGAEMGVGAALVLGCGTSELSAWVADCLQLRFGAVVSMDNVPEIIDEMRRRRPDLEWEAAAFEGFNCAAPPRLFAAAFDKGTFDVALTDDGDAAGLLRCVHRSLLPGAPYAVVSFRPTALVRPLLSGGGFFELLSDDNFGDALGLPHVNLTVFRRLETPECPDPAAEDAMWREEKERQQRFVNSWFREVEPLLTPERCRELEAQWAEAAARAPHPEGSAEGPRSSSRRLPLPEAHKVLFTEAELSMYSLEDFLGDLEGFREERRAGSGGSKEEEETEERVSEGEGRDAFISLEEALAFLAANQ